MSYIKSEFKKSSWVHILIGAWLIFSPALELYYMNYGQGLDILSILIGVVLIFLGIKIRKANRLALIGLILFHIIQLVNFQLSHSTYQVLLGPFIHLNILDFDINFGIARRIWFGLNSLPLNLDVRFFNINLFNLVFIIYFLDQIRFIPKKVEKPWESEFTESDNIKEK